MGMESFELQTRGISEAFVERSGAMFKERAGESYMFRA
jgi:hypothetical protein